jgi:hypothetical protein
MNSQMTSRRRTPLTGAAGRERTEAAGREGYAAAPSVTVTALR